MTRRFLLFILAAATAASAELTVRDDASLRSALGELTAGTVLKIAPGEYSGGWRVEGIARLTIEALDAARPPHFRGGSNAWHFSKCDGLVLRSLRVSGQKFNGVNLDDGGDLANPVKDCVLELLDISDIGPRGNCDGIKVSGLRDMVIRGCTIAGWGGQGIDFVGCHDSLVTGCRLEGKPGFTASAGVQMKGGSSGITVEKCQFKNAGERPLNVGGSTGAPYFRPLDAKAEASRIIVRENIIEGGMCAAAFVGVDGAEFSGNTVRFPSKWIFRILQETQALAPCRNVVVKNNRIIFTARK